MWLIILVFFALLFLDFFAARSVQSSFTRMILFVVLIVPWDAMGWMLALDILIWFSGVAYIDAFMWCRLFDKLTEKRETDWFTGEKILKSYQKSV